MSEVNITPNGEEVKGLDGLRPQGSHPLAGKTVTLKVSEKAEHDQAKLDGAAFRLEDWWKNVAGKSWMDCNGNSACLLYAVRAGFGDLPTDDNVVYGKIGPFGYLVHVSELGEVAA